MSGTWPQSGQHSGRVPNNSGPFQGPPPICFKCGGEHYVVSCPQQTGSNPTGPPPAPVFNNQQNGNYGPSGGFGQRPQWGNGQSGSVPNRFPNPKVPPVVTRYAVPGSNPQVASAPTPYGPPVAAPQYQQYPGSAPPIQSYQPPPQPSYTPNSQPYGPSGTPQAYNQPPPQSYSAPPTGQPYVNTGYQPPPQNQYPQRNGPPQFPAPTYQNPPQQFAPPPVATPYQASNTYPAQNTHYAGPSSNQAQASQWNNADPASSYSPSPFQQPNKPQFPAGIKREYSGTPRQHSVSQSTPNFQQIQQQEYGSERHQSTPQTVVSIPKPAQPTSVPINQSSPMDVSWPAGTMARSKSSRSSSASFARPGSRPTSRSSNHHRKAKSQSITPSVKAAEVIIPMGEEDDDDVAYEDGELTEEDLRELEFKWELEKVFFEQPPTENVCLAQPLSTTWESTPVPLLDRRLKNSVSRYARKDNLKDFMRPIRSQPQWSYLQEDPAFSDLKSEGLLVPLQEVPAWMAARHGVDLHSLQPSRKRARSEEEEHEQEDVDNQIKLEAASEHRPSGNKRQKNEDFGLDTIIVQTSSSPTRRPGTPTLARAGSPSSEPEDDVWAPQPGECASAPVDPTEALLASLGVSGSPKPVRKASGPPLSIPDSGRSSPSFAGVPQSMSPQGDQSLVQYNPPQQPNSAHGPNQPPQQYNHSYGSSPNGPPPQGQYANGVPQQGNPSYGISPQGPSQGQFPNGMPQQGNPPYVNHQYNASRQNSYGNGISPQGNPPYTNQPYSVQRQNSFGSAISPQGNPPHGNQQYGMPRKNSFGNGMPQQQTSHYGNHPNAMPQQHYPPQNQYGPPISVQSNALYGPVMPAQANPPYAPQQNTPFSNPSYGMAGQQYPPQNQYNNGMVPQNIDSHPHTNVPYSQPNFAHQTNSMPQQGNHSQPAFNNNAQNYPPPRQDSGYASARGSYSNGSGTNHGLPTTPQQHQNQPPQHQTQPPQQQLHQQSQNQVDAANNAPVASEPEETNFFASLPSQFPRKEKKSKSKVKLEAKTEDTDIPGSEQEESPLTPTSMEILGKLIPNNESGGKKIKRPQPVVEAAYSRRW